MANESLSVDELLEKQNKSQLLATLEAVPDKPNLVKLTPWNPNGGCQCHLALQLPKESIASVEPTGDFHLCCGKRLSVVVVAFREGYPFNLAEIYTQFLSMVQGSSHGAGHNHPFDSGESVNYAALPESMNASYGSYDAAWQPSLDASSVAPYLHEQMPTENEMKAMGVMSVQNMTRDFGCAPGQVQMLCAGRSWCVPPNSSCSINGPCVPPNNQVMLCAGRSWCVPPNSSCSINGPCVPPNNQVMLCAGRSWCVPPNSSCGINGPCTPPNNQVMLCAGRSWCVRPGARCCANGPC